ncbi:hypothetical protein PANT_25c00039 [Moesziomyces antarcticus T-34]|uniref:Glutathione S-transferase kappa n=1 Tax=Pseudozyma antarctica (strain T-34) TaxID=1151754 RepID=M9M0V5_PSEA3|nr:hypothetical protein PANT_25c00039 [Moesziomyces antarcticus T-34]
MSGVNKVLFYYDVVSPWSYVGYVMLRRYEKLWNLDITYKPVNLGYIMKFSGNKPPITVANKGVWMWAERERAIKFYGVTLNQPKAFPINTMHLQTFLDTLTASASKSVVEQAIETCFAAIWHDDKPCATREDVEAIVEKLDIDKSKLKEILDKSMDKPARAKMQEEAKVLVEQNGLFGMPSFEITRARDGEQAMWFGSDRFEHMAAWLGQSYKGPFANDSCPKL